MTKRPTTKLRRGTQEILERRSMAASPDQLTPTLHTDGPKAAQAGGYVGDVAFSHGGRRAFGMPTPLAGPAHHAELPGHRHRGAEQHSAH
ncbi:hypothetical protein [Kitasatospora sp. MAP5-34]|uniref:hypothetical protein n=1 Tax=Kitasatospora sp. MAP5-34 TaxID=3035102 RepID=UPI002475CBA3|nr:hypothetical protein [Kitasatospora sp. MAP5-34]MDH6578961.1 hypothetical protein [Kitasatospora sp. MAP5-34]